MNEETRFPFRIYTAKSEGIITEGYHSSSVEIVEITHGNVSFQIGTETVEATAGDFLYVPSTLVFRAESKDSAASHSRYGVRFHYH